MTRRAHLAAALAAVALTGCDSGAGEPRVERTPPPARTPSPTATPSPEARPAPAGSPRKVIDGWARTLARSDEDGAVRYFAPPVIVSQGPTQRLASPAAVRAFNASLPCGAQLLATRAERGYVVATFRLKDRPGHRCDAPGEKAAVAFMFRDGRISEWRQVPVPGEDDAPPAESETA